MIKISPDISLPESELKLTFIRSPGPGGQNVNKVATAIQLRFNLLHSPSLPDDLRLRLLVVLGNKITRQGDLIIKATRFRTQERNKQDAFDRLQSLLQNAAKVPKNRRKTKPTYGSTQKRLEKKKLHGKAKSLRRSRIGME